VKLARCFSGLGGGELAAGRAPAKGEAAARGGGEGQNCGFRVEVRLAGLSQHIRTSSAEASVKIVLQDILGVRQRRRTGGPLVSELNAAEGNRGPSRARLGIVDGGGGTKKLQEDGGCCPVQVDAMAPIGSTLVC
jgi:hypothetical protein